MRKLIRNPKTITLRPHLFSALDSIIFCFLATLGIRLIVHHIGFLSALSLSVFIPGWETPFQISFLYIVPLMLVGRVIQDLYDEQYVITHDGVLELDGVVSFSLKKIQISYQNIRTIELEQTILERLLGIGTILLGTTTSAVGEITISGIKNPERYKKIIEKHIRESQLNSNRLTKQD